MSTFNILLSSGGRRVALLRCFRDALCELGLPGSVFVADASLDAPAFHLADASWQVPLCSEADHVSTVLEICREENISLLVPTIDAELEAYAEALCAFRDVGTVVCISEIETVRLAADKLQTHVWLNANGFPTVRQGTPADVLAEPSSWHFPVIVKPRFGSASSGVRRMDSLAELAWSMEQPGEWIVQELGVGEEYTVNLFVDRSGLCRCAVPHRRIEVRSGEVSKAITVKHQPMMDAARRMAEALPGAYGPLNTQCFLSPSGDLQFIEINPRFGGGYPLAHRAGARFTHWLMEEALHRLPSASFDEWVDDLAMLRYDEAVFMCGRDLRKQVLDAALATS